MRGLLRIDPRERLTPSQALQTQFFQLDACADLLRFRGNFRSQEADRTSCEKTINSTGTERDSDNRLSYEDTVIADDKAFKALHGTSSEDLTRIQTDQTQKSTGIVANTASVDR